MAGRRSFVVLEDDHDDGEVQQLWRTPKRVEDIWQVQSQPHATTSPAKIHQRQAPPSFSYSVLRRDTRRGQVSKASDLARSTWSFPSTISSSGANIREHSDYFIKKTGRERQEPAKPRINKLSNAKIVTINSGQSVVDLTEDSSDTKVRTPGKLTEPVPIDDDSDIEVVPRFNRKVGTRRSSIQLISPDRKRHISDQVNFFRPVFEGEREDRVGDSERMSGGERTKTSTRNTCKISSAAAMITDLEVEEEQIVIDLEAHEERVVIDLVEVEEQVLCDLRAEDRSPAELNGTRRRSTKYLSRDQPILHPFVRCEKVELNGKKLMTGKYVEAMDGDFYRITDVFQNPGNGEIALRGHRLQRCRYLNGLLPKKRNELCWVVELEADDCQSFLEQSCVNIDPATIKGLRRANLTNWPFPSHSFRDGGDYSGNDEVERTGMLAVRWRSTAFFSSARDRFHNVPSENAIQRLLTTDLDDFRPGGLTISDEVLRSDFRGHTEPGGAYKPIEFARTGNKIIPVDNVFHPVNTGWKRKRSNRRSEEQQSAIDLTDDGELEDQTEAVRRHMSVTSIAENEDETLALSQSDRSKTSNPRLFRSFGISFSGQLPKYSASVPKPASRFSGQKYTYGDAFCGAGGASRGAVMAGLKVKWGFDFSEPACKTWHQNFPEASIYRMWAHRFIARGMEGDDFKVDIMHLSPPCQFYSPAHTVPGKDDEMNSASLFACGELLDVARPRVVTLEQTFGLYHAKFRGYFNSLIHMFTSRGFSIRWKICAFQNWGLPQRRQRLVIIASCPGEVLPEFPPFTHGEHPSPSGVKKWNSVDDVLNSIPIGAPDHDIHAAMQKPLNMPPWDSTSFAPRCITTHGGHIYHPSGVRAFTNREFASLQGFPLEHTFCEPYVKRQIGNAVPPTIAKVLFMAVKKALEKADGIQEESIVID